MSPGIVAESDLSGNLQSEYVFFNGKRVARKDLPSGAVSYYFSDHLKTASVVTDSSGNMLAESDYYPWGGELQFANNDTNHYKFTGKQRDGETGLDYFGARYYGNWLGRFLTPDWAARATAVPYAEFGDPQSLNLYSYVRNRPTLLMDPDGHKDEKDKVDHTEDEKHGPIWRFFHNHGLFGLQTANEQKAELHQRADQARKNFAGMKNFRFNGMTPQDFAKSATDQQIIDAQGVVAEFLLAQVQANTFCSPGVSCGIVLPFGAAASGEGVTFGHGARHLAGTGLTQAEVESAIAQDVKGAIANAAEKGGFCILRKFDEAR
jgi:RHS repeat-associated protein